MKKRLVALTLVAAMALGMTACGSKSNNKTTTNDNSDTAVSTAVDWTSYDELVESIRTEADLAKRAEMMHQAEDMLMDTWCVIPLYYYNDQYMLKDYVTDVYSTVEGMKYFYNAKNTKNAGKLNIFSSKTLCIIISCEYCAKVAVICSCLRICSSPPRPLEILCSKLITI